MLGPTSFQCRPSSLMSLGSAGGATFSPETLQNNRPFTRPKPNDMAGAATRAFGQFD